MLRKKEDLNKLDISFVEGAISLQKDAEKLKKIRKNSKFLIAIGSCACTGMPAAQRNNFSKKLKNEIAEEVKQFNLLKETLPIDKFVKVDEYVQGCPMDEQNFLDVFDKHIKKLG